MKTTQPNDEDHIFKNFLINVAILVVIFYSVL